MNKGGGRRQLCLEVRSVVEETEPDKCSIKSVVLLIVIRRYINIIMQPRKMTPLNVCESWTKIKFYHFCIFSVFQLITLGTVISIPK